MQELGLLEGIAPLLKAGLFEQHELHRMLYSKRREDSPMCYTYRGSQALVNEGVNELYQSTLTQTGAYTENAKFLQERCHGTSHLISDILAFKS